MISVCININGNFLVGRSATRIDENRDGDCEYKCDDGTIIKHDPDKGAVELAIKMLRTIKEDK